MCGCVYSMYVCVFVYNCVYLFVGVRDLSLACDLSIKLMCRIIFDSERLFVFVSFDSALRVFGCFVTVIRYLPNRLSGFDFRLLGTNAVLLVGSQFSVGNCCGCLVVEFFDSNKYVCAN